MINTMMICHFDTKGFTLYESVPPKQRVNHIFCLDVSNIYGTAFVDNISEFLIKKMHLSTLHIQ